MTTAPTTLTLHPPSTRSCIARVAPRFAAALLPLALAASLSAPGQAHATQTTQATQATTVVDPDASYPALPDLPGADIRGEAGVVLHLQRGRALVELDGQLYELGGRPLELAFEGLSQLRLLVELPDAADLDPTGGGAATIFVSEGGTWVGTVSATGGFFDYDLHPADVGLELAFEIAVPGSEQAGPTYPDIVVKPKDDDPDPQ